MWEGTLYSQRLKRKQADPFSAQSYIPVEFKECKQDDLYKQNINTHSNYEDDANTVNTNTNIENYFIANEKSKLQQSIEHGAGTNVEQQRPRVPTNLLNPTSTDLHN